MADGVEIAKDSLDVLGGVFQVAATFSDVSDILKFSSTLGAAFPAIGAILALAEFFLPDGKHEEILRGFSELGSKIDLVRNDIQDLKNVIRWDITELQYVNAVDRIELGMKHCVAIGTRSGQKERERYQNRLKELCAHEYCALALNAILDGIIGKGIFRGSTILDKFYYKTEGNRPRISALATRLLQVICGGIMVISTYETLMRNGGVDDVTESFYLDLEEARDKAQIALDRCVYNFEENMLKDLNRFLDTGKRSKDLVDEISDFMSDKYDWLENFCLVYDDMHGSDKHCIGGFRVDSLHRNGRCGVVYYRTKGEPPRFSHRYDEAYRINNEVECKHAQKGYSQIVAKLDAKGIGWSGCAVIKRLVDVWARGDFSTKIVTVAGKNAAAIIFLR